jgi:hypothetical protein
VARIMPRLRVTNTPAMARTVLRADLGGAMQANPLHLVYGMDPGPDTQPRTGWIEKERETNSPKW